jgi:hypothetical protein
MTHMPLSLPRTLAHMTLLSWTTLLLTLLSLLCRHVRRQLCVLQVPRSRVGHVLAALARHGSKSVARQRLVRVVVHRVVMLESSPSRTRVMWVVSVG